MTSNNISCQKGCSCNRCVKIDAGNFFGSGLPPKKIDIGNFVTRFPTNGDSWTNTTTGGTYIYLNGVWTLMPLSASASGTFFIETATGPTGPTTAGPLPLNAGDTLRLWSAGGISFALTTGSVHVEMEPNNILKAPVDPTTPPVDTTRPSIYFNTLTLFK